MDKKCKKYFLKVTCSLVGSSSPVEWQNDPLEIPAVGATAGSQPDHRNRNNGYRACLRAHIR